MVVGTVVVGVVVVVDVVLGTDVIIVMGTLVVVMILLTPLLSTFTGFLSLIFCLLLLMTNLDNGTRCVLGLTNL